MENYNELIILIAEDDNGHAELITEGLHESGICNKTIRFENGHEVWQFLNNEASQTNNTLNRKYLLLLDINMPKMDGVEVLRRLKSNPHLKNMPVIMLTTTDDPREIDECYAIGCNLYVTKPIDFVKFAETLKRLGLFIQIVSLPNPIK
jgi:CheY-like chemotaxis protein